MYNVLNFFKFEELYIIVQCSAVGVGKCESVMNVWNTCRYVCVCVCVCLCVRACVCCAGCARECVHKAAKQLVVVITTLA